MIKKYKKKDGTNAYMFQIYLGVDPISGKKKRTTKRGFKTQQEAKLALARLQLESKEPDFITETTKTFEEVCNMWLEQYKNTVKASTYTIQKVAIDKHILPLFGHIRMSKITIQFCQKQVNHWFSYYKKYSNLIGITTSVFNYAINIRLLNNNPMDGVIRPKKQQKVDEEDYIAPFYDREQLLTFLSVVKENYSEQLFVMFRILGYTGLRKGELHALRWKDIDFHKKTLTVKQTLATIQNWELVFQPPKTRKSIRTISLDDETLGLIKKWKLHQQKFLFQFGINSLSQEQLLFPSTENKPLYLDYLNHNLSKILKENNLPKMTVHGFRHTHCSLLFEAGVSIKDVQERMGHTDIKTTMNIYAHVTEQRKEKTAHDFANFMANGSPDPDKNTRGSQRGSQM